MQSIEQFEQDLIRVATELPRRVKLAAKDVDSPKKQEAKRLLQDERTCATACYRAALLLLGPTFRNWEPESTFNTLHRMGIDVPLVNRDKLLAAVTLSIIPAFFWELHAFENTVMAFNSVLSDPEVLQEATPGQLAYAIYEALLFYPQEHQDTTPEFDYEPMVYVAAVLHRAGFLVAPSSLSFAQQKLDEFNKSGAEVSKAEVTAAWDKLKKQDLHTVKFPEEDALSLQLGRLLSVELYLEDKVKEYASNLASLA